MIVAVTGVRVMKVITDQVVDMVTMRHCRMAAGCPMAVRLLVTGTGVRRRARGGIRRAHYNRMLVNVRAVHAVEMAVVQVVDVIIVLYSLVPATDAVRVTMSRMLGTGHRPPPLPPLCARPAPGQGWAATSVTRPVPPAR